MAKKTKKESLSSGVSKSCVIHATFSFSINHKDIKMTIRYAKLADSSGRSEIDNLEF